MIGIKRQILIFLLIIAAFTTINIRAAEWAFSLDSLRQSTPCFIFSYPGTEPFNINRTFSLPVKTVYLESDTPLTPSDFFIRIEDKISIVSIPPEILFFDNRTTGIDSSAPFSTLHDITRLHDNVLAINRMRIADRPVYAVSFLPLTLDSADNLTFARAISLAPDFPASIIASRENLIKRVESTPANASGKILQSVSIYGLPYGIDYVIVTSPALAASFQPLVTFKNACGFKAAIALIDSVKSHYSGIDDAEKVRNYLADFHRDGGRYVLLGGDATVVPVRYLLYYNVRSGPSVSGDLMPSDLYYADLTGDWDKDADNIWGEPNDDSPDFIPELKVGRIPAKSDSAISNYISKLLQYCTGPGQGDYSYLNKTLFFSSDEMRDYPLEGQHGAIASVYPPSFLVDTFSAVEFPSGADPNPSNPDGSSAIQKISEGYGIVNIIAHGRTDGFVVKSANYGDWPASFIFSCPTTAGHGSILNLQKNGKTSFFYSLACDVGGYDLDSTDGADSDWSLVERLMTVSNAGAIGMVANSRWGWVYSSYLLHQSFFKYLFGAADGNPFDAMALSWLEYPYLRDLIYGQNFFGDPSMTIYENVPIHMDMAVYSSPNGACRVEISAAGNPVANASMTLSSGENVLDKGTTDASGVWTTSLPLNYDSVYAITANKEGYIVVQRNYSPSIAADIKDKNELLPAEYELKQNYPNPFNPSTIIEYAIPVRSSSQLDIFNLLGQLIRKMDLAEKPAGRYSVQWDGKNNYGREVSSGIYFYRIRADKFSQTKKMVLLR